MNDDELTFADWRIQVCFDGRAPWSPRSRFEVGFDARTGNRFLSTEAYAPQLGTVSVLRGSRRRAASRV
jgi:hypothetical protein